MAESTASLRQEILALSGIDIMLDRNTFKSTYQIMDELSTKWEDLSDIAQASITELVAGKHQGNIMSALMANFDTARAALETSLTSSGSAMAEHEKWSKSLEARLLKLKATWQSLSQSFLQSDFLKVAIDSVISLANGIDGLIGSFGALPTIIGTVASGLSLFKNKGLLTFNNATQSINLIGNSFSALGEKYGAVSNKIGKYNSLNAKHQMQFCNSMKNSNTTFGKYISGLNGGKASMGGYIASLVGAKVATVGLQIATAALNAAITMGISFIISGLVSAIQKWINAEEELAEKVNEVTSKFKEQHNELTKNKSSFEADANTYAKLSKGVDDLGRNVSLTTDEYSEYQSVVNKIADQIPSLVTGYDSQGNAILNVKGNVEELTKAYEKLIKAQNDDILKDEEDITKDFKNSFADASNGGFSLDGKLNYGTAKALEEFLNKGYTEEEIAKYIEENLSTYQGMGEYSADGAKNRILSTLSSHGIDTTGKTASQAIAEVLKEDPDKIKVVLDEYAEDVEASAEEIRTIFQAKISNAFDISDSDYASMSESLQNIVKQVVSNLDARQIHEITKSQSLSDYVNNLLDSFKNIELSGNSTFIEAAFNLETKFNNGEISYGEFVHELEDAGKLIDTLNLTDDVKSQLKLSLGLNEDNLVEEYETLLNRLTETSKDNISKGNIIGLGVEEAKKFIDNLSAEELSVATDIIPELDASATVQQIQAAISREMAVQGLLFDLNLEVETASIDAFNTALQESASAAGLSSDSIAALKGRYADLESEGYNLSDMFEETSNGIHLNRKAVRELEKAYAEQKQNDIKEDVNALKKEYDLLTQDINKCNDASERASLYVQRDAILQQINDAATLAAQYDGLTSAYNDWLAAEESGQERDMYEKLIEGFENVDDEISRGWLDDGTIEFLELLTGRDLTTAPIEDLKQAYADLDEQIGKSGYSIRDFFTVNEDGDSTNTGVYNFLETIESLGGKYKDAINKKDGRIVGFDFKVAGGDEAIAEALGVSEELVEIMVRAADDAGFVVNLEGAYTQLADLKTEAETARNTLIDLKKNGLDKLKDFDVNFDLSANGKDLLAEQEKAVNLLEKFKKNGKIDLTMDGAQQALDIAEYLTIRLDDLTEPRYMQVDASILDESLKEPVEKMQEFERLSKEKHLLSLTGDTEGLKNVNAEMDNIAEYLYQIDDKEVKAKLDIEGLDTEEIKEKLESGEIELAAELNLDVQMSDDLKDMRLMMMNQLGLVSDNEVKLKIGYEIDDSIVNKLTDGEQEVVVKYLAEHKAIDNWKPEQKNAFVKYLVDYGDVDNWSPETKESFVKYFVDENELQNWSPEAKTAFVKYIVDGGEPDKFNPEDKETWVVYEKDSTEVDGYVAPDLTATVTYEKDSTEIDGFDPPDLYRTVYYAMGSNPVAATQTDGYKATTYGGQSGINGTAHVNGTTGRAFKQGSWGTKNSGTALVGELGRETLVRDGKYYTIGDSGAEFIKYRKDDIIFNHRQTEELFANGKVTSGGGRGKAFADGTAFAYGSSGLGGFGKVTTAIKDGGGSTKKKKTEAEEIAEAVVNELNETGSLGDGGDGNKNPNGNAVGGDKDKEREFKESFDWIEIAISRIERAIDNLDRTANNVYKSWSDRNSALSQEISKVGEEIRLQEDAAQRYLQKANSLGLDKLYDEDGTDYATLVRSGAINIKDFAGEADEKTVEKIKDYQKWYELYLQCTDAAEELRETEAKLYQQRFEHVQEEFEGVLQDFEHTESMLNEYISQAEEKGYVVSKEYYNALIKNETANISKLKEEQAALIKKRNEAEAGGIDKNSQAWRDMCAEIDSVTQSIEEGATSLIEYANAIRDIDWEVFDLIQERISDVTAEADFLIELMSNKKLFNDDGQLTEQGISAMGLHAQNYNTYMYRADEYGAEIADLDKQIANDPYDQELINRRRELIEAQREAILNAENEKNAIKDLVEEGINLELDALQERIDLHNEELDSMKDLYDYQKRVKEQSKEIASLEKQMASYSGNDSEEAKAKIQELKVSLEEAKSNLEETEFDRYISEQQSMLDTLYTDYETILNTRLDNVDALLTSIVSEVNTSASTIKTTLETETGKVGAMLSAEMAGIWGDTGKAKSVVTTYGEDFRTKSTTTNTTLSNIKVGIDDMMKALGVKSSANVNANNTSSSSQEDPTAGTPSPQPPIPPTTIEVGGKIDAGNAKIYDYAGDKSGETQYFKKDPIYKVLGEKNGYLKVLWHKLSSGVTGWFKKSDVKALATGAKRIDANDMAWTQENGQEYIVRPSDGAILTPVAKGDSVLNATASSNIWNMANSPTEFIKDNLKLNATSVPNNSNVQSSYTQHLDKVIFNFPNVKNYDDMLSAMQKDRNFEKLVLSMTIDQIAGKSSLTKGKSIR